MHPRPQNRAARHLRLLGRRRDMRLGYEETLSPLLYAGRVVSVSLRHCNSVILLPYFKAEIASATMLAT